ncbi:MAG: beta-propeller fold lactonase family protein [Chloroflexi bacterium]|nr:beta-propeller fold lactonase family protein [Chloroflexota bacterium]
MVAQLEWARTSRRPYADTTNQFGIRSNTVAHGFAAKGYTPITESLRQAAASLPVGASERNQVVLVSDGEETCAGDPCALAAQLAASDVKLVIHAIGLAVDNATRAQLQCIARVSNGTYRDATNAGELSSALEQAARESTARALKEIQRPSSIAFSPDGQFVYITASGSEALFVFRRDTSAGKLTFVEMHKNGVAGVKGLDGANSVAVSPDGRNVYAIGLSDDAIVTFTRNTTTGALTWVAMHKDGVGGVDGLNEANFVTLSPDGKHVYVTSSEDDALVVFTRNATTGALTFAKMYKHGVGGVDGLNRVMSATVSPDGKFLYTTSDPSSRDDPVVLFRRDANPGLLTFVRAYKDDVDGVDGLQGGRAVVVSADLRHLYVTGRIDSAVTVFARNLDTGALTFVQTLKNRVGNAAFSNLDGARGLAISPDGQFVYVSADVINTLIVFKRDSTTGALTFTQMLRDNADGVDGLENAHVVAVSPDGKHVYVPGFDDNAVAVFNRDASAGSLSFVQAVKEAK